MMREETKYFYLDYPIDFAFKKRLKVLRKAVKYKVYELSDRFWGIMNKQTSTDKRYKVCLCAIFKDEGEFLKEWLEYHMIVGVEHFYLYNNDSSDNYLDILEPYIKKGIVTLIDWPGSCQQIKAYKNAIRTYSAEAKWLGFIDIDEFVVPIDRDNIYDILKPFDNRASAVLIYWKMFGSSGLIERQRGKLVTEQFIMAWPKMTDIGKCFYNTDYEFDFDLKRNNGMHHSLWCRCKSNKHVRPPLNVQNHISFHEYNVIRNLTLPIQINHYVTKSYCDWGYKANVKSDVFYEKNPRSVDYIASVDQRCTVPDYSIYKYILRLKKAMREDASVQGNPVWDSFDGPKIDAVI